MVDEKKIEKAIENLPPISPSVHRVIALANQMNASPIELSEAIKVDPILTGRVLKLINSAYFGMPQQVTSLNRAIILLGVNTIKNLALSTALRSTFESRKSKSGLSLDALWIHSVSVGVACKMLALYFSVSKREIETYFIAGLLHDIGKLLFDQSFSVKYKMIVEKIARKGGVFFKEERKIFGLDHAEVSGIICRKWQIGENLVAAIQHHEPSENETMLASIVRIADAYINRLGEPFGMKGGYDRYYPEDLQKLNVSEEKVAIILKDFNEEFEKATVFIKGEENEN